MTKEEFKEIYARGWKIEIIMEAKPRSDNQRPTLIDLDVIKEMIEFENFLMNLSLPVPDTTLTD